MYQVTFGSSFSEFDPAMFDGEYDSIERIVRVCIDHGFGAVLYDNTGFKRGWVHADGNYTLT